MCGGEVEHIQSGATVAVRTLDEALDVLRTATIRGDGGGGPDDTALLSPETIR